MRKSNCFISQKKINEILKWYGGKRKYQYNEVYTTEPYASLVFTQKKNKYLWLVMHRMYQKEMQIEVTLTDDQGKIIQRDFYALENGMLVKNPAKQVERGSYVKI